MVFKPAGSSTSQQRCQKKKYIYIYIYIYILELYYMKKCLSESHTDSQANYVAVKRYREFNDKLQKVQLLTSHREQKFSSAVPIPKCDTTLHNNCHHFMYGMHNATCSIRTVIRNLRDCQVHCGHCITVSCLKELRRECRSVIDHTCFVTYTQHRRPHVASKFNKHTAPPFPTVLLGVHIFIVLCLRKTTPDKGPHY